LLDVTANIQVLNTGVSVNSLGPEDGGQPAKLSGASVGRKLLAVREAFSHCKASEDDMVSPKEVGLVLKSLCLPGHDFKCDINSVLPSLSASNKEYSFDDFCGIAAEVMFLVRKQNKTEISKLISTSALSVIPCYKCFN
jgi:hypothetical protein